jgi:hypothetical protein
VGFAQENVGIPANGIEVQSFDDLGTPNDVTITFEESVGNGLEDTIQEIPSDIDEDNSINISRRLRVRALLEAPEIFSHSSSLNTTNPDNYYFFSTTTEKNMIFGLTGSAGICAEIYIVDYSTGYVYPTDIYVTPNQKKIVAVPAGDYALRVYGSTGSYSVFANRTIRSGNISIINYTSSLSNITYTYNGIIYVNGSSTSLTFGSNSGITYNDSRTLSPHTGEYIAVSIVNTYITNISLPVIYSNERGTFNNVILLYLGSGTSYFYFRSLYTFDSMGNVTGTTFTSNDYVRGISTPRYFDAEDAEANQFLAYDLNTGTVIDYFGINNFFYAFNIDSYPTITQHN